MGSAAPTFFVANKEVTGPHGIYSSRCMPSSRTCPTVAASVPQGLVHPAQALREHLRIDTHADADVAGHFEEPSRYRRCVVLRAKLRQESVGIARRQADKRRGPPLRRDRRDRPMPFQEVA